MKRLGSGIEQKNAADRAMQALRLTAANKVTRHAKTGTKKKSYVVNNSDKSDTRNNRDKTVIRNNSVRNSSKGLSIIIRNSINRHNSLNIIITRISSSRNNARSREA